MKTLAIARAYTPKDVCIWAEDQGTLPDGSRKFLVINGGWVGVIAPDGEITAPDLAEDERNLGGGIIVWEGEVPKDFAATRRFRADYNEAIAWITEQINGKEG